MDNKSGESTEKEVTGAGLGEPETERLLSKRNKDLIPETSSSMSKGTIREHSVIHNEDDVRGRARMTRDEERVLLGG